MFLVFTKYWKPIAASAFAVLLFAAGWKASSVRWEAKVLKAEQKAQIAYEAARDRLFQEWDTQRIADEAARVALSQQLSDARTQTSQLEEELRSVRLTPVEPVIETVLVPGDCESGQPEVVLANPFSPDFVRLWNDSARRSDGGRGPATE